MTTIHSLIYDAMRTTEGETAVYIALIKNRFTSDCNEFDFKAVPNRVDVMSDNSQLSTLVCNLFGYGGGDWFIPHPHYRKDNDLLINALNELKEYFNQ